MTDTETTLEYRVYWRTADGRFCEESFASLTEATIRKEVLKRQGVVARIVGVRVTVGA